MVTSLFAQGICVLVPGTRRSIGDVPFNVIGGTRARLALGVPDCLGRPMPPFTVYIKMQFYVYQDLLQKPSEILVYHGVEDGGLALHHLGSKVKANLTVTLIQTSSNPRYISYLYTYSWLHG